MTNHVLLDNVSHKDLRVRLEFGPQYGDNVGSVPIFATELADVQREYPVFFRRDKQGDYYMVALLGFAADENLFLEGPEKRNGWDAWYVPAIVAKGPFLIGFQERQDGGELRREPVIHVDLDNPRISQTEGERVFMEQGGHSPYLQHIGRVLSGLNDGHAINKAMFAAFNEAGLIAPIDLELKITGSETVKLPGFYSIDREKLSGLDAEALFKLHRAGFLQGAHLVLTSHATLNKLVNRKIARVSQGLRPTSENAA